jgi:hypothetical protein
MLPLVKPSNATNMILLRIFIDICETNYSSSDNRLEDNSEAAQLFSDYPQRYEEQ